jgi:hypothetical protein
MWTRVWMTAMGRVTFTTSVAANKTNMVGEVIFEDVFLRNLCFHKTSIQLQ